MNELSGFLLDKGVRALIGKGGMGSYRAGTAPGTGASTLLSPGDVQPLQPRT